jgi:DNA (cytosine-5)-methyltransferase 1
MTAYYNEHDPYAAQWLRNLIAAGHIAPGVVDERSIVDIRPDELTGYTQCHFFAGIGGWSLALRLAGWPDDKPVWTGSCPCQPFSTAGKGAGFADERHLWPAWHWLIEQCRPSIIFGEQVAAKAVDPWIDLVSTDLEALGFAFAAVAVPAAGVGAPHIRDRLWWVGDAMRNGNKPVARGSHSKEGAAVGIYRGQPGAGSVSRIDGAIGELGDAENARREGDVLHPLWAGRDNCGPDGGIARSGAIGELGDPHDKGSQGRLRNPECTDQQSLGKTSLGNVWGNADWLPCRDGKARPVEPSTFPLAHGAAARVGRLRAYGNAIVPQAAAEFIGAYLDVNE